MDCRPIPPFRGSYGTLNTPHSSMTSNTRNPDSAAQASSTDRSQAGPRPFTNRAKRVWSLASTCWKNALSSVWAQDHQIHATMLHEPTAHTISPLKPASRRCLGYHFDSGGTVPRPPDGGCGRQAPGQYWGWPPRSGGRPRKLPPTGQKRGLPPRSHRRWTAAEGAGWPLRRYESPPPSNKGPTRIPAATATRTRALRNSIRMPSSLWNTMKRTPPKAIANRTPAQIPYRI